MTDPRDEGQIDPAKMAQELKLVASLVWQFYRELQAEGFNDEQALRLTMNWHAALTRGDR